MRHLRFIMVFLVLAGGFLLAEKAAGLLVGTQPDGGRGKTYRYRVAAIMPTSDESYWYELRSGMAKAAERFGVGLEFLGPRYPDNEQAVNRFSAAIAAGTDGIICQVEDSSAISAAISRAIASGITVVTVGSDVLGSGRQGYVGSDPFYLGYEVGRSLRAARGRARIAVLLDGTSGRTDSSQASYMRGLRQAIAFSPGLMLAHVARTPPGVLGAQSEIQRLLAIDKKIDVVCCVNPRDTLGVAKVLRESERGKHVVLIGTGLLPEILLLLQQRALAATTASYPFEMGFEAVRLFCDIRSGRTPPHIVSLGAQVYRPEDAPDLLKQLARHEVE